MTRGRFASTIVLASAALTACGDAPTAPVQAASFVRLAFFDDLATRWDTTRSFIVLAATRDTVTPFPLNERLPAILTTSAGDHEQLLLGRRVCNGNYQLCQNLVVGLVATADFTKLAIDLDRQGARIRSISGSRNSGGVFAYDDRDVVRVAHWLLNRPEVRHVNPSALAFCGLAGCAPTQAIFTTLDGGIRLRARTGQSTHFDSHLEVQPGDTITVSIEQPDGSFFRLQQVAGPWSTGGVIGSQ